MKLIKIITAVVMSFGMMVAQPPTQGGNQDGNQDGNQGPPPFQEVDTNGDGKIDREEARAMFGQDEDGNPDPEFDSRFDSRAGDDGLVDQAEYDQADQDGGQPPECDVCGYTFTGEGDHHGHCDNCDFVFTSDNDQHGHCDKCDYTYSGGDDRHGHCSVCDAEMNTDEDWRGHCDANPDHCRPQAGDTCGYGHDGDEACDYVFTGDEGEDHHHCDLCGLAVNSGEEMHNHLEADHPNRPARDNCEALDRGLDSFINQNGDAIAVWATNGDGSPACGQDNDGNN
jgi:hypothetical protein